MIATTCHSGTPSSSLTTVDPPPRPRLSISRPQRQLKILELINTHVIRTQEELADALAREGWEVTQSSVSRDIAALRLVKVDGAYHRPLAVSGPAGSPDEARIAEGVLTMEAAGDALVVLHTPPGEANRVGAALDRLAWPDLLGTIAGDDTIFLAVCHHAAQRRVVRELRRLVTGSEAAPEEATR